VLALLRAVARSSPYRANRQHLLSREPEDVWYAPGEGWIVTYRLLSSRWGQLLVFILADLAEDGKTSVTSVFRGAEEGRELTNDPELDLTLG
jgi:hypothetical protein